MAGKNLKKIAGALLAIGAIGSLVACGSNDSNDGDSNKVVSSGGAADSDYVFKFGTVDGSVCLAPLHIALEEGYFDEEFKNEGIAYEAVEIDLAQQVDLIVSGKIDGCVGLAGSLIPKIDNGLEIAFTGGLHTGCTKVYVKSDSKVEDFSDLKGLSVGVPELGDSSVVAIKRKLYEVGIDVSEVNFVEYALPDLPLALENGAIDAAALHDPIAYNAEEEYGFKKILDLSSDEKFADEYCCMSYVSEKSADEHPEAVAAYTRALLKASAFIQANPEKAAQIQIDTGHVDGDAKVHATLLSSYNYTPSVSKGKETIYNAIDELVKIGDLSSVNDDEVEDFVKKHYRTFDNVPDSYKYEDGEFKEITEWTMPDCCKDK